MRSSLVHSIGRLSRPILTQPARIYSTSTVNTTEVQHFNALASTWWDPYGECRLLHLMNPLRHEYINRCLKSSDPTQISIEHGRRHIDVGCGGGIFTESAARMRSTGYVLGVDPSKEVINVAEDHAKKDPLLLPSAGKLEYKNSAIENVPIPQSTAKQFDVLSLFEVVEHVSYPSEFLKHCMPFVKPGGWIIGSTIARTWTSWFTTVVAAENILGLVPKGTHEWDKYIHEHELRAWFNKEGWIPAKPMGVLYVPGIGWREVPEGEKWGNYFFGFQKRKS